MLCPHCNQGELKPSGKGRILKAGTWYYYQNYLCNSCNRHHLNTAEPWTGPKRKANLVK